MLNIPPRDPLALAVVAAIRSGDLHALQRLVREHSSLLTARIGDTSQARSLLHLATDWPGHFPNAAATITALVDAGADVNAPFIGGHSETPLHWAASSDDVAALDVLLDRGANIAAKGGVIGDGTPLADAVAFGQWRAARRLVERGARPNLWQAAALGLMDHVRELFAGDVLPTPAEVDNAFWCACHGGQRQSGEFLLEAGAHLNAIGHDELTPIDAARRSGANALVEWLGDRGARSAAGQ